jgi:hypothetical protein
MKEDSFWYSGFCFQKMSALQPRVLIAEVCCLIRVIRVFRGCLYGVPKESDV